MPSALREDGGAVRGCRHRATRRRAARLNGAFYGAVLHQACLLIMLSLDSAGRRSETLRRPAMLTGRLAVQVDGERHEASGRDAAEEVLPGLARADEEDE